MGIVVIGAVFIDIKGFPEANYIPDGRNVGRIEYVHGGVGRNVAEDIANVELRPYFLSIADNSPMGDAVMKKLNNHKVLTDYMLRLDGGMGSWLAVFDNKGDVAGSISQRPDMMPISTLLEEKGDEIFANADSVVIEVDMDKEIVKKAIKLAEKYGKKIFGVVANMSIASERRDFLRKFDCFICNRLEAGTLFANDYYQYSPEELVDILSQRVINASIPSMIVTLGDKGAVYADRNGDKGLCPARNVNVRDTTGAGDAFCAGTVIGLTYGKSLRESVDIGSFLAASVIATTENVCPRFQPRELGLDIDVAEED